LAEHAYGRYYTGIVEGAKFIGNGGDREVI
jgi:hypothetical protein